MNYDLSVLSSCTLFQGIGQDNVQAMLGCLDAKRKHFAKDAFLLRAGSPMSSLGLVLSGSVFVVQEDFWGNRNILAVVKAGECFAETAACVPDAILQADVVAQTPACVLFLDVRRILTVCSSACVYHAQLIRNLLADVAEKNLHLNEKLTQLGQRTTRAKLLAFLSAQARKIGDREFDLAFSRQQLADWLSVERSGLSTELGKLRAEGLLEFHKNHFRLKTEGEDVQ